MDFTRAQRRAAMLQVHEMLREAVLSEETNQAVFDIASKNNIPGVKIAIFSEEVANVLLGLRIPSEFIPALQRRLGITAQAAQLLANDVNTQVFKPVRIPLLKMFELNNTDKQTPQTQPPTPSYRPATQAVTSAPTPATPIQNPPIRIPTIVPPPGIGTRASDQPQPINKPAQSAQASQFVQYQPLKQNPFEIKPIPAAQPTTPTTNQPLNPNTLNASSPQIHTLKEDIKNMTIVQQKLQNVVSAPKKTIEWTKPEIKIGSNGAYTTDPYREPPQP